MKTNPTAKQPALASTGKGASLLFQKNQSRAKGHLKCFRIGLGQSDALLAGRSARLSSVDGAIEGIIVVKVNGEGRGVACRAIKPKGKL
jgi:hypothetical protein